MKSLPCNALLIIMLGLTACSSVNTYLDSRSDDAEKQDYLVYLINEHSQQPQLRLYDPVSNTHTQILSNWDVDEFSLSANNRLAFSSHDADNKIHIADYPFGNNSPIELPVATASRNTPLSWSPDGRFLLFASVGADSKRLSIWDAKRVSDILEYQGTISEVAWSPDGRLAFTEFYGFDANTTDEWGSSEVFVWDGNTIVSVSQNPSGEDRFPAWSKEGKLAFLSNRDGKYEIFVWDGFSKHEGIPDSDTFLNVAPKLIKDFSKPKWTNSDSLAFGAGGDGDTHVQVYIWDGHTASNISNNPLSHNGGHTWRSDGYWSFATYFSESQNIYIKDETNRTILATEGQYAPAWSQSGLLIFCRYDSQDWILSMWNGVDVIEISRGGFILAKWTGGEYVACWSG